MTSLGVTLCSFIRSHSYFLFLCNLESQFTFIPSAAIFYLDSRLEFKFSFLLKERSDASPRNCGCFKEWLNFILGYSSLQELCLWYSFKYNGFPKNILSYYVRRQTGSHVVLRLLIVSQGVCLLLILVSSCWRIKFKYILWKVSGYN